LEVISGAKSIWRTLNPNEYVYFLVWS
jgi:hypothetical protein